MSRPTGLLGGGKPTIRQSLGARLSAGLKALRATPAAAELFSGFGSRFFSFPRSEYVDGAYIEQQSATYAHIYASQENVRIVVDAVARGAAKRSLKLYVRNPDGSKIEDDNATAAATMRTPNDWQSQRELLTAFVKDKLVYDDAYLWDMGPDLDGRRFLVRVPPHAMGVKSDNKLRPSGYRVQFQDGTWLDLRPEEVIHWRGYSAADNRIGVSPLETLRTLLIETSVRKAQSIESVKGGLIKGGIVTRGLEAPEWSNKARERFQESFASRLKGVKVGGIALLEDGMQFMEAGITPREAEMLQTRQFELALVANLYGVNPALFTTSGNLAQAREMLDEDVVEPMVTELADALTHQLVRGIYGDNKHFFRFRRGQITDLGKLFEAGSKATGGSVLTTNEFRDDYLDKPPVEGGDEITKHPGSQGGGTPPAPGSEERGRPELPAEEQATVEAAKAALLEAKTLRADATKLAKAEGEKALKRRQGLVQRRDSLAADVSAVLRKHFRRQLASVKEEEGKALDSGRWNDELAADLYEVSAKAVEAEGALQAARFMGEFDSERTVNYLKQGARIMARNVNKQTESDIREARAAGSEQPVRDALKTGITDRADRLGSGKATALMAFASMEAAAQVGGLYTKTWVSSGLPASRHGELDGETVHVGEAFSNGLQYPGDPGGDIGETAHCQCSLDVVGGPVPGGGQDTPAVGEL